MKKGELVFVILLISAVSILLYESQDYYRLAKQFPQLVGGIILFLLLWDLGISLWKRKMVVKEANEDQSDSTPSAFMVKRWLVLGINLTLYVFFMPSVGFLIMTTLLILSLLWFFNVRKPMTLIVYTGSTVCIIYGVFAKILYVPLPAGTLW